MEPRRLVKAGASSHTIALPKAWLDRHKLGKGDTVYVDERNETLVITPALVPLRAATSAITISVDGKELATLQREVTAAYLNNYGTITLQGKGVAALARELRQLLHGFVAIEITEQTGTRLVAKDFLNLAEVDIDATLRRMDMMVRSMLEDGIGEEVIENAHLRDEDINRLFFLLYRVLRRTLDDPLLRERLKLGRGKLLSTWAMIHYLEQLGDASTRILHLLPAIKGKQRELALELARDVQTYYLDVIKAYHTHDASLANKAATERAIIAERHAQLLKANAVPESVELALQLSSMTSLVADIARVVIDENPSDGTSVADR